MAADDVALFQAWIDAFNRWDTEWLFAHVTDDVHWEPLRAKTEGVFHGRDGVRRFIADTEESFDLFQPHYDDVRDLGDGRVLGLGSIRIRGRGSGVETDVPSAVLVTFRDGQLAHLHDHRDREKALEAAGLS